MGGGLSRIALYECIKYRVQDVESIAGVGADVRVGKFDAWLEDYGGVGCWSHCIVGLFLWSVAAR